MIKFYKKISSIFFKISFLNISNTLLLSLFISIAVVLVIFREQEINLMKSTESSVKIFDRILRTTLEELSEDARKAATNSENIKAIGYYKIRDYSRYNEMKKDEKTGKYYYTYKDISNTPKYYMKIVASEIAKQLYNVSKEFGEDQKIITIVDENMKIFGTSNITGIAKEYLLKDEDIFIKSIFGRENINKTTYSDIYYNVELTENGLILRGGYPIFFQGETAKGAIIISWVVGRAVVEELSKRFKVNESTKIFFLYKENYLCGNINFERGKKFSNIKNTEDIYSELKKINNEEYFISYFPLKNIERKTVGFIGIANSKKELNTRKIKMFIVISIIVIFVTLINVIISLFFSYKFTKPIIKLQKTAAEVMNGNYNVDFKIEGRDEISQLSMSLNQMFEKIKDYQTELIKNEKLNTMLKLSSSIVHELRTPVTGIRGFASMIKNLYSNDPKLLRYSDAIEKASIRVESMASDLLEYAENKKPSYEFKKFNLTLLIAECYENNKNDIVSNCLKFEIDVPNDIDIVADRKKMSKVFNNLIRNSIEAIDKAEPIVKITGSKNDNDDTIIKFYDNGIGIKKEHINEIFEPMYTTKIQGTGLGLTIVKDIIEGHGGKISVVSEPGVFTEFEIILNKEPCHNEKACLYQKIL